ncbi:hypothetical protein [Streptomyces mirabilis]|uniref:hypothetical protein n=1 Tax=Streptomyces mirabilis TaxID=68239 RepID=UPI003680204C
MTETVPSEGPPVAQVTLPDGRVEIAPDAPAPSGPYANEDLLPVPVEKRTWTTYNFSALCVAQERTHTAWQGADQRFRQRSRWSREHVSAVRG